MSEKKPSLAYGAKLTAETFADFIERLRFDCNGERVNDHCTADAFFRVENYKLVTGIDPQFTDQLCVCCDDQIWNSPIDYWDDSCESRREELDAIALNSSSEDGFLDSGESEQWRILAELDDHYVTGWTEEWVTVNTHLTYEAAEAFIKRKKHDYRLLRVFTDAHTYGWEYNAIKQALLNGTLMYVGSEKS